MSHSHKEFLNLVKRSTYLPDLSGHIFSVEMVIDLLDDNIGEIDSSEVIKIPHHGEGVLRQVLVPHQSVGGRGQQGAQSDVLLHCLGAECSTLIGRALSRLCSDWLRS